MISIVNIVELAHVVQGHEIKQSMIATWDANFKNSITTYAYFFDKRGGGCPKRWKLLYRAMMHPDHATNAAQGYK